MTLPDRPFKNETAFLSKCIKFLLEKGIPPYHKAKGPGHKRIPRNHFIINGIEMAWPDIYLFPGNGRVIFIELKMPGEKLTKKQQGFMMWALSEGYGFYTCWTWRDFMSALVSEGL